LFFDFSRMSFFHPSPTHGESGWGIALPQPFFSWIYKTLDDFFFFTVVIAFPTIGMESQYLFLSLYPFHQSHLEGGVSFDFPLLLFDAYTPQ